MIEITTAEASEGGGRVGCNAQVRRMSSRRLRLIFLGEMRNHE
jgi:hypothetical protein